MATNSIPVVAILGCGKRSSNNGKEGWAIGHAHAEGWLKACLELKLCGVDISPDNLAAFGKRFELPTSQLFASSAALYATVKPDFVSVCTWPALHAPMVLEAVKQGAKGIICEKPMALDLGEMTQMRDSCAKAGVRLAIAHQRRYEPNFQLGRKLLHDGAIGEKWVLEARVADNWDILSWTVHWFDIANFFFGSRPVSVLAGGDVTGQRRYQHAVENASVIFAEYPEGHQAIFITGPVGNPESYGVSLRGTKGLLQVAPTLKLWNQAGYSEPQPHATDYSEGFAGLMGEMLRAAGTDRPILCGVENCFAATEMAYAAHESIRTQRKIALPLAAQYAPLEVLTHEAKPTLPYKKVVLLADEHFGSGGREGLAEVLKCLSGESPTLVEAATGLSAETIAEADLLVLYHTHDVPSMETQKTMRAWVGAGKPLLLVHAALGAYPQWDEYTAWCGRVWDWGSSEHPHEPTTLVMTKGGLTAGWSEAWLPRDEVFIKLGQRSVVKDLLTARISTGDFPAAWISSVNPNIGIWVPGHRRDLWSLPAMREGLAALARAIQTK